jgi:anti-sigma28 factor (negative regulator of flagellin synthesis)
MINTEIVNEIARIMRQQGVVKDGKDIKEQRTELERRDAVELTREAVEFSQAQPAGGELEKEQRLKVERLKSLVNDGHYKLSDEMVEAIAARIAKMFIRP